MASLVGLGLERAGRALAVMLSIRFAVMSSSRLRKRISLSTGLALLPLVLGSAIATAAPVQEDVATRTQNEGAVAAPSSDITVEDNLLGEDAVPAANDADGSDDADVVVDLGSQPQQVDGDSQSDSPDSADESDESDIVEQSTESEEEDLSTFGCGVPTAHYTGVPANGKNLGGKDRYKTSVAIANAVKAEPDSDARAVFIASGEVYADGLAVGALAVNSGWPLMLVGKNSLDADVKAKIADVRPTHIYVAGGTGAVSNAVVDQVKKLGEEGAEVVRFAGSDRYETSAKVATCFPEGSASLLVTGSNFADAVVAGPVAAKLGGAIVLTTAGALHAQARSALASLKPSSVDIIGGKWSAATQNQIKSAANVNSVKVHAGSDRYATSSKVAEDFFAGGKNVAYANGTSFPDSLSGVSAAATVDAPIILTKSTCRPKSISAVANKRTGTKVLLGGQGVVSSKSYSTDCVVAPKPAPKPATKTVASVAKSLVGSKANSGSAATNPSYGFDCSGFTQYVHAQVGKSIPRTTWAQWSAGKTVSVPSAGDVIVMTGGSHVGIYMGGGMIVDSPGYAGAKVQYRPIWGPTSAYVRF